jgi:hypothetical protein
LREKWRVVLARVLVSGFVLMAALGASAQPRHRVIQGTVFYKGGEPANRAAVQLEDEVTLQVVSRMTDVEGHYHFDGLNPDRDYQVIATKGNLWSKSHHVSRFSSRPVETVVLYLSPQHAAR